MPSRLGEYCFLLKTAIAAGYEIHSINSFWQEICKGLKPDKKYLVLRHDIDTDVKTAKDIFTIEQKLGVRSSYYFRLSTIDIKLMQLIDSSDSEASYHYEEIATVAKQRGFKTREQVYENMGYIRQLFKKNLESLRKQTNLPMKIVASHGDFVNRKLKVPNWVILDDQSFRNEVGVELEVYDSAMMDYVSSRHTDTHYPYYWKPRNPIEAIESGEHVIYILTHPRHWQVNLKENIIDNVKRLWEGLQYRL